MLDGFRTFNEMFYAFLLFDKFLKMWNNYVFLLELLTAYLYARENEGNSSSRFIHRIMPASIHFS